LRISSRSIKKKKAWKDRRLLKEAIMSDGFKLTFWLYEWNDDVALRLGHRFCVRIIKLKPDGHVLLTEQIGIRVDNWDAFIDAVNKLVIDTIKDGC
jgi:hypothetical protein